MSPKDSLGAYAFNMRRLPGFALSGQDRASSPLRPPVEDGTGNAREVDLLSLRWGYVQHLGLKVRLVGKAAADPSLPEGAFHLFRFAVICCVADARPLSVVVRAVGEGGAIPPDDSWVEAEGVVDTASIGGQDQIVVRDAAWREVSPPADPYLFGY